MSKWTIRYTKFAYAELDAIYFYIAEQLLEPEISAKQVKRITTAIGNLDEMPHRNPLYAKEPWKGRGLRKLLVDNYMVFYVIDVAKEEVVVMHILYGGRDIDDILKNEAENIDDRDNG